MATMLPNEVESFHTEGEERFYRFLQRAAQPDREFIAWYTPDIADREPDFLLYHDALEKSAWPKSQRGQVYTSDKARLQQSDV